MAASEETIIQAVDPSWFESPVERLKTSGGTAPFFRLILTEEGLEGQGSRNGKEGTRTDKDYWIGKDLSHAEDEKDFYAQILRIRSKNNEAGGDRDNTEGVGLLEEFMFDYLGVLRAKTSEEDLGEDGCCNLLVMRNMRNKYNTFRMLDLKIGEKTAQAGWKGKSRFRALKHHVMDTLSNSAAEGYRLCGFNGCPAVFDSIDPLIDMLDNDSSKKYTEAKGDKRASLKTMWGQDLGESKVKQAERFLLNSLTGTEVFRFFYDLHMDDKSAAPPSEHYLPIEVSDIVSHEFMSQLINLSIACHKLKVPQKWIGSSVAVVYDSGLFPDRSLEGDNNPEAEIRSKVLCKIFDWGRSELLTADEYDSLTPEEQEDRDKFWAFYKEGIDRLSYNATRFYYHQFTKSTMWTKLTIQIMDFDSMTPDDYIGKVEIPLPYHLDTKAVAALSESTPYKLKGMIASRFGSTVYCSISWIDFPDDSRLLGAWRVTIDRATNLPPLDISKSSDPYCMVMAEGDKTYGQHFHQRTCVKARDLNPEWNETIDIPVSRVGNDTALSMFGSDKDLSDHFQWDKSFQWDKFKVARENMKWWTKTLIEADKF